MIVFLVLALYVYILKYIDKSVVCHYTFTPWYEIKVFSEFLPLIIFVSYTVFSSPLSYFHRELIEDEFMFV